MEKIINYGIQSGICLLIFYLFYQMVLKRESCFRFNRFYLLLAPLVALVLPLIKYFFPLVISQDVGLSVIQLPAVSISDGATESPFPVLLTIYKTLPFIYINGAFFLLLRLIFELYKLLKLAIKADKERLDNGLILIHTNSKLPTFSFMKYIFWNEDNKLSEPEAEQILLHEQIHIKQKHSLDILFFEILCILFWPNPLFRLFRNEIKNIHEYLADNQVISRYDTGAYSSLLARQFIRQIEFSVTHHFSMSNPLKRIKKMETKNKKTHMYKLLLILPLVALTVVVISCMKDNVESDLQTEMQKGDEIFTVVENDPVPSGGMDGFYRAITKEMKYPAEARRKGIEGKVFVEFVVEKDGSLSNFIIRKGIDETLDAEAVRAIKEASPNWSPGTQRGKPQRVNLILPIKFKIGDNDNATTTSKDEIENKSLEEMVVVGY